MFSHGETPNISKETDEQQTPKAVTATLEQITTIKSQATLRSYSGIIKHLSVPGSGMVPQYLQPIQPHTSRWLEEESSLANNLKSLGVFEDRRRMKPSLQGAPMPKYSFTVYEARSSSSHIWNQVPRGHIHLFLDAMYNLVFLTDTLPVFADPPHDDKTCIHMEPQQELTTLINLSWLGFWTTIDGKACVVKDVIEGIDKENNKITFKVIEGDLYKSFKFVLEVIPKGNGSEVHWVIEYEKQNENIPDPHTMSQFLIEMSKDIDAYITKDQK
ncbi:hypothetical protein VNO77_26946 [Canavalia gladiata]|uniref:Bet v I/Major latex protein domain-containing protein n=1 Tax=Canavalia gladiata TaxID=3824 RepID=A0AAN9KTS3_CANGL